MRSLDQLAIDEQAKIFSLRAEGEMRRRLQDLGFVPGAEVMPLFRGCSGDPTAYLVFGAVIALRREDAARIQVQDPAGPATLAVP